MDAPVFIAPGNHDWYGSDSPYATMEWPENVLSALPKSRLDIQIIGSGEQARTVVLHAKGQAYMSLLAHLAEEYHESVRN